MDWTLGYSASYYAAIVDPVTWRDVERFEVIDGKISKTDTDLRASADITCSGYDGGERWVRLYLDARQDEETVHVPLFTGLTSSPEINYNGVFEENPVLCYSVLKPASDILLERGWYAPAETEGATLIRNLLSVSPAPISTEQNSPLLKEAIVAEDGETNLSMSEKILSAIGWRLRVGGDGTIEIKPYDNTPVASFDSLDQDAIEPEVDVQADWYKCPNVFRAVSGDMSAVAKDEREDSILSIANRGREIWMEETHCDLNADETIEAYAMRRLREEQRVAITLRYTRRFNPDILAGDTVRLHYPEIDVDGTYLITSQTTEMSFGGSTSEEAVKI